MTASPVPAAVALEVVQMARQDRFDAVIERLAPPLRALVDADALRAAWEAEIGRQGSVVSLGEPVCEPASAGVTVVRVPVSCAHGGMTVVASVSEAGLLMGLQLAPAAASRPASPWGPPPYVDVSTFTEREVHLGTGPLAVPGTLAVPTTPGRHPGVVLLGGSGPVDRDGTIGPNKPLKDLAWGLASRGVATLRFEKVTFAHPDELRRLAGFTLADEYVPAALAGIDELRRDLGIDPSRVFVAGHSLGGTAAPRVAAAAGAIAGLVLLGAGAAPLHRAAIRQIRYLASLNEVSAAANGALIERLEQQADLVDSDALSPSTPAAELPFGVPAAYWLDLRRYDPVAAAEALGRPILLVQGGRDYQATVDDDLVRWRAGLSRSSLVTERLYPAHNHLLAPGSGPSSPAEYDRPSHVDVAVVEDVERWLTARPSGVAAVDRR